jgi:hypothetical protein
MQEQPNKKAPPKEGLVSHANNKEVEVEQSDDRITPRTVASLEEANFDADPWLNALSPITPATTDAPIGKFSWANLITGGTTPVEKESLAI